MGKTRRTATNLDASRRNGGARASAIRRGRPGGNPILLIVLILIAAALMIGRAARIFRAIAYRPGGARSGYIGSFGTGTYQPVPPGSSPALDQLIGAIARP